MLAIKDNFIFNDEPLFLDFEQAFQEGVWVPLNQQCPANKILHFNEGHWAVLDEQPSLTTQQISYNATDAVYQANDIRVWQCFLPLPLASRSVFDSQKADRLELCITYPTAVFATNETVSPPVEHATTQYRFQVDLSTTGNIAELVDQEELLVDKHAYNNTQTLTIPTV